MAKSLKEWCRTHVKNMADSFEDFEIFRTQFYRNPHRAIVKNSSAFKSPADGVIINQTQVNDIDDEVLKIKGKKYTLRNALGNNEEMLNLIKERGGALVIDVFMTYYDVHYNRIPTDGFLTYEKLLPTESYNNESMLAVEEGLFANNFKKAVTELGYMFCNERLLNIIYSPVLQEKYAVVQIADEQINCIQTAWVPARGEPNTHLYQQGDIFGNIRKGSQCTIVIPFSNKWNYIPILEPSFHVEAGIDELIRVEPK
ncbi:putative phosphatidyl-serine decarboxylase [Campylobacter phage F352]|uniref:Putative phosphatidyl-serine decarboxylase n=3 Tax=Fletchervirus CPX TaxID=1110702 RepID=A0A7T3N3Z1_9CAUD|nr:putative phosphatidyl-serine decarboxylase [Campylobacter phage F352]QPX65448.1 putative phosphatidyl-serine decarboxylase [Campylobacter phage F374]QPX65614.1 putative phosphatidyl-serine decarboxylase [Campylobacter phage F375]QXO06045.1 hypothetical protein [Campylobacter phage CJLB-10]